MNINVNIDIWQPLPYLDIAIPAGQRVLCAILVGLIFGLDREWHGKPAGARTFIMICLGSCILGLTSELLQLHEQIRGYQTDQGRFSAYTIGGVGVLASGLIMQSRASVKGITNAAFLWSVGCVGAVLGHGFLSLGLSASIGLFLIVQVHRVLEILQNRWAEHALITVRSLGEPEDIAELCNTVLNVGGRIYRLERTGGTETVIRIYCQLVSTNCMEIRDWLGRFREKYGVLVEKRGRQK